MNGVDSNKPQCASCIKKSYCLVICILLLLGYVLQNKVWIFSDKVYTTLHTKQVITSQNNETEPYNLVIHDRLNEVIGEREALMFSPCQDAKLAADSLKSTLKILGSNDKIYNIGDKIYVTATLYDSYGRKKTSGGDQVRAKITNSLVKASAPGVVFDHENGSYTIIFEALWSGKSRISATIAYTREAITALYRMRIEEECVRQIWARYKSLHFQEDAVCHTDSKRLLTILKYKDVCNFTSLNSGMPWYCGKPKDRRLECKDWKFVRHNQTKLLDLVSSCERVLLGRRHRAFSESITATVRMYKPDTGRKSIAYYQPDIPCSKYNVSKLWFKKFTTGFYYKGQWNLKHCKGFHEISFKDCLRNKKLYLFGDSTTRDWYTDIMSRFNCKQFTEKWAYAKWKRPSGCTCPSNNFTALIAIHSQPFYISQMWSDYKYSLVSIPRRLEKIDKNEDALVLIHIYLHMLDFHYKYFSAKMNKICDSIMKLLQRNRKVKVFIKMPHTFHSDFFGYVFTRIIIDTFKGLYTSSRIIILDHKDITLSFNSVPNHPNRHIVKYMVNQMFSYVCK